MALARQLVTGHVTSRLPPRALVACLLAAALLTHPAALASQSSYQDVEVGSEGSSDMAFIKKLAGLSFPFQTQNPFLFAVVRETTRCRAATTPHTARATTADTFASGGHAPAPASGLSAVCLAVPSGLLP